MCDNSKKLKKKRVSMWYKQSGLDNIRLEGVAEYKCDNCGETYQSFGDMDQLHRLISKKLIGKKGRLTGAEVRFLRVSLGFNSSMFAKLLGVDVSHLSRIEGKGKAEPVPSNQIDHSIRFLVASRNGNPDRDYDLHDQLVNDSGEDLKEIKISNRPSGWKSVDAHP
jgi:YgiT-type zinc finger domain-containing protein